MGTDHLGRDLLSRLIHGSRVALFIGLASVGLAAVVGSILGLLSGYASGLVDEALMRVMDALLAFPSVLLALGITAALGPGTLTIVVAIAVADLPVFARLTRGQVLSVRERDFVTAARAPNQSVLFFVIFGPTLRRLSLSWRRFTSASLF